VSIRGWVLPLPFLLLLIAQLARVAVCIVRCRTRVVVPWTTEGIPFHSPFAEAFQTRDGSSLIREVPVRCTLLLWKRPDRTDLRAALVDFVTGGTGVWSVAVDCGLRSRGARWVITAGECNTLNGPESGPLYAPFSSCRASAMASIDISGELDGDLLLHHLAAAIEDRSIRFKGAPAALSFALGIVRHDRVNCSSLIGTAILRQSESRLAAALRQALRERISYGEITPADLARMSAILALVPEGASHPITTVPLAWRQTLQAWLPRRKSRVAENIEVNT
jgi:hypothetical protein